MNISLRKANALQLATTNYAQSIQLTHTFEITEYTTDLEKVIEKNRQEFRTNYNNKLKLTDVVNEIRTKLGFANANYGVSNILAEIASIDAKLRFSTTTRMKNLCLSIEDANKRLEKLIERSKTGYSSNILFEILDDEMSESLRKDVLSLKKKKQKLQDGLLTINITREIELSKEAVEILKEHDLI